MWLVMRPLLVACVSYRVVFILLVIVAPYHHVELLLYIHRCNYAEIFGLVAAQAALCRVCRGQGGV